MYNWIKYLRCPECKNIYLRHFKKNSKYNIWGYEKIICSKCKSTYPISKSGILNMLPKGNYSKYDYWDNVYVDHQQTIEFFKKRFSYDEKFLLNYYVMANLCKKLNWYVKDSVELGCGWASNSLALYKLGVVKKIWLVDISTQALEGAIKVANAFGIKPYAIRADIHNLPFKDNAFELSLSGGLYEHFIGKEQKDLIKENCRISKKILCQVPENNITYNLFRFFYTLIKGKWPFGFEVPVNKNDFVEIYNNLNCKVVGYEYSNLLTAIITKLADKFSFFQVLNFRPFIYKLFSYDIVIANDKKTKYKYKR